MTRARIMGIAGGATVLLGAGLVAWLATRGEGAPAKADSASGHNHAAAAAPASGLAGPVQLTDEEARRIGVTYAVARMAPVAREVRTVGQVTFDETRMQAIAPKLEGFVERLYVNATGQPVRAGQPLLSLYAPMAVAAQEELLLARRLAADVRGGTDDARRNAGDLLTSARRRLAYWDVPADEIAAIERDGVVHRTITLRSHASGYVLEKNVLPGQRIMPGDVLFRVADLSTVWVEGEVFEQDLAVVRVGQTVHADFQALPGEHRMGRIAYVYPTLDPSTRTAKIRVVMRNEGGRLLPGMYATLRLDATVRRTAVTVPRTAVLVTGERSLVFVKRRDGRLEPREVRVGSSSDEDVEVLAGLTAGETVVSSATFLIDAESSLKTALGGMGDMPGMDMTAPKPLPMQGAPPAAAPATKTAPAPTAMPEHKHD